MAVRLSSSVRVSFEVDDETVVVVFPSYDDPAFQGSRWTTSSGKRGRTNVTSQLYEARVAFFDETAVDIENVEFEGTDGDQVLSRDVPGWKDKVPVQWKATAASYFEETQVLSEEEREDLGPPSSEA